MEDLPARYQAFREILGLNNECLELLAALQEDLSFVSPASGFLDHTVAALFDNTRRIVQGIEGLTQARQDRLRRALEAQQAEVRTYLTALREAPAPRLCASLDEIRAQSEAEAGGKAAVLGELRGPLGLRVPDGFAITTEAYRRFCETPLWMEVRDTLRNLDPGDGEAISAASARLRTLIQTSPLPAVVEQVILSCARALAGRGGRLAVRSSACGEAGPHSYAGQFLTELDVEPEAAGDAWRSVIASRYTPHALGYRLSMGISEVESPLAVLLMRMVPARLSGILYTRNPSEPWRNEMWISSIRGLGAGLASGAETGDFVAVSRKRPHRVAGPRIPLLGQGESPLAIGPAQMAELAAGAKAIEEHFGGPQDIEWAVDGEGRVWFLQSRQLLVAESGRQSLFHRPKAPPLVEGGRTVCPGRACGPVWIAGRARPLRDTPTGAILVVEKATPDLASVLSRTDGLVAEWGNVTGHAAALLREFRVPSVFLMRGAMEALQNGQTVSLDASARKIYPGSRWPPRLDEVQDLDGAPGNQLDPIHRRVLNLNLLHPTAGGFHPEGCKSLHDVLRYCHERAVESMFSAHDALSGSRPKQCHRLSSHLPINVLVLDLGGAIAETTPPAAPITSEQIRCRPFQAIWKGFTHPEVQWTRDMPISFADMTSVLAGSLSTGNYLTRALGEQSYLMVAPEYFNLNARLAYHFTLIDACLSDLPSNNHVSFRFAGGGASRGRRNLRAIFIDACLTHYGFHVDRRGDLVNAWLKNIEAQDLAEHLDILGRLTATTSQLDMYMTSREAMEWYVAQFIQGNYRFTYPDESG